MASAAGFNRSTALVEDSDDDFAHAQPALGLTAVRAEYVANASLGRHYQMGSNDVPAERHMVVAVGRAILCAVFWVGAFTVHHDLPSVDVVGGCLLASVGTVFLCTAVQRHASGTAQLLLFAAGAGLAVAVPRVAMAAPLGTASMILYLVMYSLSCCSGATALIMMVGRSWSIDGRLYMGATLVALLTVGAVTTTGHDHTGKPGRPARGPNGNFGGTADRRGDLVGLLLSGVVIAVPLTLVVYAAHGSASRA